LISSGLAIGLLLIVSFFPNNTRLWAALHGINPQNYFIVAEDSTGIAGITEANHQGTLLASGQAQANFPYLQVHALMGTIPALMHPHPEQVLIIGLGSGGTAHTIGVNPLTKQVEVIELIKAELTVLRQYAQTPVGQPLRALFQDPRYRFTANDGRKALSQMTRQFDIIETDAIYPWRSRAGMLYSQEFFQTVQSHLVPGGLFVEWNVGPEIEQTFRNVFPYVALLNLTQDLSVLVGSDRPIDFNREAVLTKLESPIVLDFLNQAEVDVAAIRRDVKAAKVQLFSHQKDGQPPAVNTDLFPRSEYYLNQPIIHLNG
jgi:spermidine synthase